MSDTCKYFITGGGTGGHIYPALAVAEQLGTENVYYIGNPNNLEYRLATEKNFKFLPIKISGMPRKINFQLLKWAIEFISSVVVAFYYLKKYKPVAIFGTGGYVSAPIIFAAMIEGKTPYMLHDCDSFPGIVTRKTAQKAKTISLAFKNATKYIKNQNCVINGNPIRAEFKNLDKNLARQEMKLDNDTFTIGIMGGSQGAKSINNSAVEIIRELTEKYGLQIIFQTGTKNYESVIERLEKIYPNYKSNSKLTVQPYFENMPTVLKSCDIIISRAGSLSISEICACGIAPILIPFPNAAANHQMLNAQVLEEKGACICIKDSDLNPNILRDEILNLISTPEKLYYLQQNASSLAKFDALENITNQLKSLTSI